MASESTTKQSDDSILTEARARFKEAVAADADNRENALDDLKFVWNLNDHQWPAEVKKARKGRPCMTENRLPQFLRQVVNEQRRNRPSIDVAPADSAAAVGVAQIMEGMIRHIEQWSKADLAYDNAFEFAASCSIGYFRVTTEYADDEGFDQEICIKSIDNPFTVYDDPNYSDPDGSDRKWCLVSELVERDGFKDTYGVEPSNFDDTGALGDDRMDWFSADGKVRIAEYWRVVEERSTVKAADDEKRTREVVKRKVEQYLMTGDKIIRRTEWLGKLLPIIPVYGEVKNIEGRKWRKSLIRDAKSAQQTNNYFLSAEIETTALQPKVPTVGAVGQFRTDKARWKTAHVDNHPYLEYDVVEGAPPPQRQPPPTFPMGLREARMGSIEAMKAIMGIYDASLGARSNETSGIAIQAREDQGDNATFHFVDNMVRAIRYAGLVIIDLVPKIYDRPRTVRIVQPDGQAQMVAVNQIFVDPQTQRETQYPLDAGRYDVVVKAGPSFQTMRQHAAAGLKEIIRAYPPLMQMAGDLLLKNMDFPEADKIAERLAPKPQQGMPPELQQQMQAMQQALAQGKQAFDQLQQKANKQELDLQRKDIEKMILQANSKMQAQDGNADRAMENSHFVANFVLELLKMQQSGQQQAQQLAAQAQQIEPAAEQVAE